MSPGCTQGNFLCGKELGELGYAGYAGDTCFFFQYLVTRGSRENRKLSPVSPAYPIANKSLYNKELSWVRLGYTGDSESFYYIVPVSAGGGIYHCAI